MRLEEDTGLEWERSVLHVKGAMRQKSLGKG